MNQDENEASINLADMFAYFLHHWRVILILVLVFMAAVGGYMSYRDYSGIQNKYKEETYSSMVKDMTVEQLENVNQFYNRYITYKEKIADNQFYIDNSLYMMLDANNISSLTREYLVKTSNRGVLSSFAATSLDYDDYTEMAKVFGDDVDPRYVNELVSMWSSTEQDSYDINTDKVGDVINGSFAYSYSGLLSFSIIANDKATCEALADIVDKAVLEHLEKLQTSGINVEMAELTTAYNERVDNSIAEYQRSRIEEGANLFTEYSDFETNSEKVLSEDELAVFNYRVEKDQEVTDHVHWKKWVVIGLGIGLVVAAVFIVLKYLLIPGIKTADDAYIITGEKELGIIIETPKSKVFLGKLFHVWAKNVEFHGVKQVPDKESIPLVCDRISRLCEDKSAKSVMLIVDCEGGYANEVVSKCVKYLEEAGIKAASGNPGTSMEALKSLRESSAAVFVLVNKGSLPDSIRSNILICKENNVPVIGNFIIHPQR